MIEVSKEATVCRRRRDKTLPAPTTGRFVILVLTAFTGLYYLSQPTLGAITSTLGITTRRRLYECVVQARGQALSGPLGVLGRSFNSCIYRELLVDLLISMSAIVIYILVVLLVYVLHPYLINRRARITLRDVMLKPGLSEDVGTIASLLQGNGVAASRVEIRFSTSPRTVGGQAYGLPRARRIALPLSLLIGSSSQPNRLRTVLRHELAHIKNRDIDLTYLAIISWWAFGIVGVAPALAVSIMGYPPGPIYVLVYALAIATVLWFERAAVVRTRELYADHAARSSEYIASIRDFASRAAAEEGKVLRRLLRPVAGHPTWRERATVLEQPGRLYQESPLEGLAVGLLIGLSVGAVLDWSFRLAPDDLNGGPWTVGVVFAIFALSVVGVSQWRALSSPQVSNVAGLRLALVAAALTLGICFGQALAPPVGEAPGWLAILLTDRPTALAYTMVLFVMLYMWLWIVDRTARTWLRMALPSRFGMIATIVATSPLLGLWLGYWFTGPRVLLDNTNHRAALGLLGLGLVLDARFLATLLIAATLPLAPLVVRHVRRRSIHLDQNRVPSLYSYTAPSYAIPVGFAGVVGFMSLGTLVYPRFRDVVEHGSLGGERLGGFAGVIQFFLPFLLIGTAFTLGAGVAGMSIPRANKMRYRPAIALLAMSTTALAASPAVFLHAAVAVCGWSDFADCFNAPPDLRSVSAFAAWMLGASTLSIVSFFCVADLFRRIRRRDRADALVEPHGNTVDRGSLRVLRLVWISIAVLVAATTVFVVGVTALGAEYRPSAEAARSDLERAFARIAPGAIATPDACKMAADESRAAGSATVLGGGLLKLEIDGIVMLGSSQDRVLQVMAQEAVAGYIGDSTVPPAETRRAMAKYCNLSMGGS